MSASVVTCWFRTRPDGIEFNHVSDGFDALVTTPVPMNEYQRAAWKNVNWMGTCGVIVDGVLYDGRMKQMPAVPPSMVGLLDDEATGPVRWS